MTVKKIITLIKKLSIEEKEASLINAVNEIKIALAKISPFRDNAVDCILWKNIEEITLKTNSINHIAPKEKRLLYNSIMNNGFTQPVIISRRFNNDFIVDGMQRCALMLSKSKLKSKYKGYVPICYIDTSFDEYTDTVICYQHYRAQGKTIIPKLSQLVGELVRLGWSDSKISESLGMDDDEILRLKQLDGIEENFKSSQYSLGWTVK